MYACTCTNMSVYTYTYVHTCIHVHTELQTKLILHAHVQYTVTPQVSRHTCTYTKIIHKIHVHVLYTYNYMYIDYMYIVHAQYTVMPQVPRHTCTCINSEASSMYSSYIIVYSFLSLQTQDMFLKRLVSYAAFILFIHSSIYLF